MTDRSRSEVAGIEKHTSLHRAFEAHVKGLYPLLDEPLAFHVALEPLDRALREHVKLEERRILPLYAARVSEVEPAARSDQYVQDHAAIARHLDGLSELSVHVSFQAFPENHLGFALTAFDDLLEHHDLREERLYASLAATLEGEERAELDAAFDTLKAPELPSLEELRSVTGHPLVERLGRAYLAFLRGEVEPLDTGEVGGARDLEGRVLGLARRCVSLTQRIHDEGSSLDLPHCLALQRTVDRAWRSCISFALLELHRSRAAILR